MIVIADDITGAAEIAGIALDHGFPVRLLCGCPVDSTFPSTAASETIVIATDTRSMTEDEAARETRRIAEKIEGKSSLFKKTDSALRGHVVAELNALMQTLGYRRAVYVPANPSEGRIIRDGLYYINNVGEKRLVPLHETAFRYDPEFPARTSKLEERFPDAESHGIIMPNAENVEGMRRIIEKYDDGNTIFAGAADLFCSLITTPATPTHKCSPFHLFTFSPLNQQFRSLILCGSTQSRPLDLDIPMAPMPREVYEGSEDLRTWLAEALTSYQSTGSVALTIPKHTPPRPTDTPPLKREGSDGAVAIHLRTVMAELARRLVAIHLPDHLMIEGGATAWATLQALRWTDFTIIAQLAPGVVQMRADCGTLVTLKPGSYPWPHQRNKVLKG